MCMGSVMSHASWCGWWWQRAQDAWHCKPVRVIGSGSNLVPAIHAQDLAQVIVAVLTQTPTQPYVVAADSGNHTLADIASVCKSSGTETVAGRERGKDLVVTIIWMVGV